MSTTLNAGSDIEVVGATDRGIHAILLARSLHPDVIVSGLTLFGISGLELIKRMRQEKLTPPPKVVVFAMNHSDQMITDVLHAGADWSRWTAQDWLRTYVQRGLDYIQNPSPLLSRDPTNPPGNFILQHVTKPWRPPSTHTPTPLTPLLPRLTAHTLI